MLTGAMALATFRGRLPTLVVVLLVLVCLALLAFACVCFGDQPMEALAAAVAWITLLPGLAQVWPLLLACLGAALLVVACGPRARARSPAALQRFLL